MFDSCINIYEIDDYDRTIEKTWTRLTQLEKVCSIQGARIGCS